MTEAPIDEAGTTGPQPPDSGSAVPSPAAARRTHLLIGALGVLLAVAAGLIAVLFGRVADARADAEAARREVAAIGAGVPGDVAAELAALRADLERVEAGAALYASQLTGYQELLAEAGPEISAGVDAAIEGLREFGTSTIEFDVDIDETIPVQTEVVIERTIEVPIQTAIPIRETFDTTIEVETPLGFSIPLDVTVPVDLSVPVDLTIDIPVDETVPIDDEFVVDLSVPIEIDVGETALADLTDTLATGLESLRTALDNLTSSGD